MEEAAHYNSWIISLCKPYVNGTLLEIGSGIGSFTKEWLGLADAVVALEMAKNCVSILNERFHGNESITVLEKDIMKLNEDNFNKFDSAVSINVFEHIDDDFNALAVIYKTLKPGGYLAVFVPAFQMLHGKIDRDLGHYRRYDKKNLVEKISRVGFNVIDERYVNFLGFFAWFFTKNKGTALSKQNVLFYDRFAVPLLKRAESLIRPPLGQSLFVACSKPAES